MLLSRTWKINPAVHLVRAQTYKGKKVDRADLPVKLRYDGMTMLGILFSVTGMCDVTSAASRCV